MTWRDWFRVGACIVGAALLMGCDPVPADRPAPAAIPEPGPAPRFPGLGWSAHQGLVCIPTEHAFDLAAWIADVGAHEERLRAWGSYWRAAAGQLAGR